MARVSWRCFVVLILFLGAPRGALAQWGPEMPLTSTGSDVWGGGIATSGSTVHVMYGTGEVLYRSSPDEGTTWTAERRLDSGTIHLTDPIWADGTDVWIFYLKDIRNLSDWCCSRDLGNIYLLHSGDGGRTWDSPRQLTTAQGVYRLSVTYAAGRLHLVWMDFRSAAWDTYYLRSSNRGASWDPEQRIAISAGAFGAERPQVAARGDTVHVTIWDDRGSNPPCMAGPTFSFASCPDTFYMRSIDGGVTWQSEINVANSGAAIAGRNDIAVAGNSSVVINFNRSAENTADANPHLFTIHSPDNGATWDAALQLTNTPGEADHGSIIGSGSNVHLAWHDTRNGNFVIYYVGSSSEGTSWDPEERVSNTTTADSSTPLVAVTAAFVHVLWLDQRSGSWQIYYRRRAVGPLPPVLDAGTRPDAAASQDASPIADASCGGDTCGAVCVDLQTDPNNCGMCGRTVCHTELCLNGAPSCAPGRTTCGTPFGCLGCKDLREDPANCGLCGRACNANEVCSQSQCVAACPTGALMCGQSCVADPQTDVAFCGGCAGRCNPGQYCTQGQCTSAPGALDAGMTASDAASGLGDDAASRSDGASGASDADLSASDGDSVARDGDTSAADSDVSAIDAEANDGEASSADGGTPSADAGRASSTGSDGGNGGLGARAAKSCGCRSTSGAATESPLFAFAGIIVVAIRSRRSSWVRARSDLLERSR
jgi:BNR repeat protein